MTCIAQVLSHSANTSLELLLDPQASAAYAAYAAAGETKGSGAVFNRLYIFSQYIVYEPINIYDGFKL